MDLKEKIIADITKSMKEKDSIKLDTLRMLKAEIMKYEVSGKDLKATDEIVLGLIQKGIKQRLEAAEAFKKGGKTEAADKELKEMKVLETYLPTQLTKEELEAVIKATIVEMGATIKEFGRVMGAVISKTKGQADGRLVNELVKNLLK